MRVLLDSFSKQERALFLDEHKKEQGNGFLLRQWIGHRPIHPRRHRSWHRQTADLQLFRPLVVSGFDLHNGRHPRQELPNHAHRHRATPITRETVFSLTHPLSACTRKRAALHLSTAHRTHKFHLYRSELLLFLHTSPTLHAPPPSTHSHPARSLPHLALGQSLRTPLGYPVSLPPLNRPLQSRLRHATCPFSLLHGDPLAALYYNYFLPFIAQLLCPLAVLAWRKNPLYRPLTSLPAVIVYAGILMVWLIVRNLCQI